jgi:hypothetical protein
LELAWAQALGLGWVLVLGSPLALEPQWVRGWVLALELLKLALLAPQLHLVAVPSNVRKPHGPKPRLRLLALHRFGFGLQQLEELKDLAQDPPEQHLQAVVLQPLGLMPLKGSLLQLLVNLALQGAPLGMRPDARTS